MNPQPLSALQSPYTSTYPKIFSQELIKNKKSTECCNADFRAWGVVASQANGKFWILFIVLYVYIRPRQLGTENPERSPVP